MTRPETTPVATAPETPRGYPQYPVYQYPQYVQYPQYYEPQYVQPTAQYVQPTPQYVQPTPQYDQYQYPQYQYYQYPLYQYYPDGYYCEIQYVSPLVVSKSNSSHSSPVTSSQLPETQQDSLVVSM